MGLLGTTTEENYYNGSQTFIADGSTSTFTLTFETLPTASQVRVYVNNSEITTFSISGASLTLSLIHI